MVKKLVLVMFLLTKILVVLKGAVVVVAIVPMRVEYQCSSFMMSGLVAS